MTCLTQLRERPGLPKHICQQRKSGPSSSNTRQISISGQESTLDMYCCIIYTINICAHTNIHIPSYTIMPDLLSDKLTQLSVPTSICQLITSFLTDRQQLVRLGKLTSRTLTISTDAPQGCVLSPLPFSFYTNYCTSKDPSVKLPKFAEDTTVIGLIEDEWRVCLLTGGGAAGCLVQS